MQQSLLFVNSELCLQLSIWVVIVSQYDIYVKDAVLHAVSPPVLQLAIRSLFFELLWNNAGNSAFFEATRRIVIRLHIGEWEVKEHPKLHVLHIYRIVIQSQLKYIIEAKVLTFRECGTGYKTAGSVRFGFLMWYNLLQWFLFGSNQDPEPNRQFRTVANNMQDTFDDDSNHHVQLYIPCTLRNWDGPTSRVEERVNYPQIIRRRARRTSWKCDCPEEVRIYRQD